MKYEFTFIYSNGTKLVKTFYNKHLGMLWAHNEGDHLIHYCYKEIP